MLNPPSKVIIISPASAAFPPFPPLFANCALLLRCICRAAGRSGLSSLSHGAGRFKQWRNLESPRRAVVFHFAAPPMAFTAADPTAVCPSCLAQFSASPSPVFRIRSFPAAPTRGRRWKRFGGSARKQSATRRENKALAVVRALFWGFWRWWAAKKAQGRMGAGWF